MKIVENRFIPFKGYSAIMLFGFLFTRDAGKVTARTVRHESIHARQMWELLVVGFYLWYLIEWVVRLFLRSNAYRNISFEREAYANQDDLLYLDTRRPFYFLKYMKK
ncbi:MAG: hypothetical protein LBD52_07520 [Prevotellaceae bacterium]|nr:hypothetical protein [Prevotellaceae bacterium]